MRTGRIEPRSGTSFAVKKGQIFRVVDIEGGQVADMVLFSQHDPSERLCNGKTFDFEHTIRLTKGNILWSNSSKKLAQITADSCGIHDFLLAPCSQETFDILYEEKMPDSPSCLSNLALALDKYAIKKNDIPTAFNIFMNVSIDQDGEICIKPPTSKSGSYIEFLAWEDLIVGLTACSAPKSNGGTCKPICYEIID